MREAERIIISKDSKNSLFGHSIQDSYAFTQNKINNAEKISRSNLESKKKKRRRQISEQIEAKNEYETMEKKNNKNKKRKKNRNENFPRSQLSCKTKRSLS